MIQRARETAPVMRAATALPGVTDVLSGGQAEARFLGAGRSSHT